MISKEKRDEIIAENYRRRKLYFRKYDPIIGDSEGEVVKRKPISIDGVEYWLPEEMCDNEPIVKERAIWGIHCQFAGTQWGADGRVLSIGFSKVVHGLFSALAVGGKSVVNRPTELAEPVVKLVGSSRSIRSFVSAAADLFTRN